MIPLQMLDLSNVSANFNINYTDPPAKWQELSTEFGVSVPTLSVFWQRKVIPLLRSLKERFLPDL